MKKIPSIVVLWGWTPSFGYCVKICYCINFKSWMKSCACWHCDDILLGVFIPIQLIVYLSRLFRDLRQAVPKPHEWEKHRNAWISDDTCRLVDERVSARRGTRVQARLRRLGRDVRASLKGDRRRRVEDSGKGVETLLGEDPPNVKEAWRRMKEWYRAAANRGPPPA